METNKRFSLCNNEHCCKKFNYFDLLTVHTIVDGPDPRDHFANERNLLTWLRTGLTLALVGKLDRFMTFLDLQTKIFAPAKSLPWTDQDDTLQVHIVSYIFIGLGISSILVAISVYFKNLNQIVNRNLIVSQGWGGYTMALLIMLFVVFVMAAALT